MAVCWRCKSSLGLSHAYTPVFSLSPAWCDLFGTPLIMNCTRSNVLFQGEDLNSKKKKNLIQKEKKWSDCYRACKEDIYSHIKVPRFWHLFPSRKNNVQKPWNYSSRIFTGKKKYCLIFPHILMHISETFFFNQSNDFAWLQ